MSTFTYWPYDEVSLETNANTHEVILKTPWLQAITKDNFFDAEELSKLSTKLDTKSLSIADMSLVNNFFKHFEQYPVAYILPTPKKALKLDKHITKDQKFLKTSIKDVLGYTTDLPNNDIEELCKIINRTSFEWDVEAAISFASLNNLVHPESLFSIARRFHIIELLSNDTGTDIFRDIQKLEQTYFKSAACRLVRQNHYVTQKCQEALEPAVHIAGQASPLVQQFMKEERGHDKFLEKALRNLGEEPQNILVSVQTKALMLMLKYIAQRNFLAFSMTVDAFERSNYTHTDPMADLLQKLGYDQAAKYINIHMNINDNGNHENIALNLLEYMDLCDRDYALEALRLMEVLSLIMSTISKSAYEN